MVVENLNRIYVVCIKCKYEWLTRSKLMFISCPNCGSKNRLKEDPTVVEDEVEYVEQEETTDESISQ